MGKNNQRLNKQRQSFLLTFFSGEEYEVKEINGFILEKHWNGDTEDWEVAIYTKESWMKRYDHTQLKEEKDNQMTHLLSI